jgi:hypothetical protein
VIQVTIPTTTTTPPRCPSVQQQHLLQLVADTCFNTSSLYIISGTVTMLLSAISTLFGLLMLSYRSRIQAAEKRELDANVDREEAVRERNEALWRLNETRTEFRNFAEEIRASETLPSPPTRRPPRRGLNSGRTP